MTQADLTNAIMDLLRDSDLLKREPTVAELRDLDRALGRLVHLFRLRLPRRRPRPEEVNGDG